MQAFVAHTTKQEAKKRILRILTETSIIVLPDLKQDIVNHPSPRKLNENKPQIGNFSCFLFETLRLQGHTRNCRDTAVASSFDLLLMKQECTRPEISAKQLTLTPQCIALLQTGKKTVLECRGDDKPGTWKHFQRTSLEWAAKCVKRSI